jgi:hypothetical protein
VSQATKLFTCPKCRHTYLGHDPLRDCPRCGYDYRQEGKFRWDVVVYLLVIIGFVSFLLVASYYRNNMATGRVPLASTETSSSEPSDEKLPGAVRPFKSPYQSSGR